MTSPSDRARRALLGVAVAAVTGAAAPVRAAGEAPSHAPFGRVEPVQPAPALALVEAAQGRRTTLPALLQGRATAVQLMFTGCSATCPIQGALFADLARRLPPSGAQLLSLSIDPLADDAAALRAWLARFDAPPVWRAAAPLPAGLDRLLDFLRGRAAGADRHTGQVYLFDARARFVYRTPEFPPAAHVAALLGEIGRSA